VRTHRFGTDGVRNTSRSNAEMANQGDRRTLEQLPDVGDGLARVNTNYINTGRSNILNEIRSKVTPEKKYLPESRVLVKAYLLALFHNGISSSYQYW
jgi:hypothetical protein